jgi:hypothetical protein
MAQSGRRPITAIGAKTCGVDRTTLVNCRCDRPLSPGSRGDIRTVGKRSYSMRGVQYLVDDHGARRAVVIDLKKQGELWEDFYDRVVAESRLDEPRESLETVKAKLAKRRGRRSRG